MPDRITAPFAILLARTGILRRGHLFAIELNADVPHSVSIHKEVEDAANHLRLAVNNFQHGSQRRCSTAGSRVIRADNFRLISVRDTSYVKSGKYAALLSRKDLRPKTLVM